MCHSIPVKSVENDKVAGSCLSEPLNEDHDQSPETSPEEEQAAIAQGEDSVSDKPASGDLERDKDVVETDTKEVGDTVVPEETFDAENISSQAVSVSEQGAVGETVDSEMGSKKGEEDEKTEESATADSASTVKGSSSVEGDDQKKRFVAFCLLETKMVICCIGSFVLETIGCSFGGKTFCAFVRFHLSFLYCHLLHFIAH